MKILKRLSLVVLLVVLVNGFIQLKMNSDLLSQTVLALCCQAGACNNQNCSNSSTVLSEDLLGCGQDANTTCQTCINLQRIDHACDYRVLDQYCWLNGNRYYVCAPLSVSLSGPTSLSYGQTGTYTATLTGGTSSFAYQWYMRHDCDKFDGDGGGTDDPPCDEWYTFGSSTSSVQVTGYWDFSIKVRVTDSCPITPRIVYSNVVSVHVSGGLAKVGIQQPHKFEISVYPNPFNPSTSIEIDLKDNALVSIDIFNLQGQKIRTLCDAENFGSGSIRFNWDAKDDRGNQISGGTYLCLVRVNETTQTLKLAYIK